MFVSINQASFKRPEISRRQFISLAAALGAVGLSLLLAGCATAPRSGRFLRAQISERDFIHWFVKSLKHNGAAKLLKAKGVNVANAQGAVTLAYQGTLAAQEQYIKSTDIGSAFTRELKPSKPNVIIMPEMKDMQNRLALICTFLGFGPAIVDMNFSSLRKTINATGDKEIARALEEVLARLATEKPEPDVLKEFFACVYTSSVFRDVSLNHPVTPSSAQAAANRLMQTIEAYRATDKAKYDAIQSVLRMYFQTTLRLPITPAFAEN